MHSKGSGPGDGPVSGPVRTSDRLRRRPKMYGRHLYYSPNILRPKRSKTKTRTAASQIAKMLRPGNQSMRTPKNNVSGYRLIVRSSFLLSCCNGWSSRR